MIQGIAVRRQRTAREAAIKAAPDGYTILLNAPGHATNPALMKLPFDPIRDFAFKRRVIW